MEYVKTKLMVAKGAEEVEKRMLGVVVLNIQPFENLNFDSTWQLKFECYLILSFY